MKYMLLFYATEGMALAETQEQIYADWMSLLKEANAAGVLQFNSGLAPTSNATTVRVREHKTLLTDGPYAETHEQLGGFFLIDCADLDEAVAWAAKVPQARYGSVEVRPTWDSV